MKIVIDIPEEAYDFVQNTSFVEDENTLFRQSNADRQKTLFLFDIMDAIRNGTPLPEHHGRLIDADAIEYTHAIARSLDDGHNWNELCVTKDELYNAPTIIKGSDSE